MPAKIPFRSVPRTTLYFRPRQLDADDTSLFLAHAEYMGYRNPATRALRSRRYFWGLAQFSPNPMAAAYRSLAETICSWTLELSTPQGRRDVAICFGRLRVVVLDVAEQGTSVMSMIPLRSVPAFLADQIDLGPRPALPGEIPLAWCPDGGLSPRQWVSHVAENAANCPGLVADLQAQRWRVWTLTRAWAYESSDGVPEVDTWTVLDTPSGMARWVPDADGEGGRLMPIASAEVWAHLSDGPNVTALALTVLDRFLYWMGQPGTGTPLLSIRADRAPNDATPGSGRRPRAATG